MASQHQQRHNRAHARHKLFQPAELRAGGEDLRVHVLDISEGGARLHAPGGLVPGMRVVLTLGAHQRSAIVAWSIGPKSGIRFALPLLADQVAAFVAAHP